MKDGILQIHASNKLAGHHTIVVRRWICNCRLNFNETILRDEIDSCTTSKETPEPPSGRIVPQAQLLIPSRKRGPEKDPDDRATHAEKSKDLTPKI